MKKKIIKRPEEPYLTKRIIPSDQPRFSCRLGLEEPDEDPTLVSLKNDLDAAKRNLIENQKVIDRFIKEKKDEDDSNIQFANRCKQMKRWLEFLLSELK